MAVESSTLLRNVEIFHICHKKKALYVVNDFQGCCLQCVIPNVDAVAMALRKFFN